MSEDFLQVSTFKIAATYVGTVIGAGFASGQEILQFFGVFGNSGLAGLLVVTLLFILYGYIIMDLGYKVQSQSYMEVIRLSGGKYFGIVADSIILFFLFGTLATMIAASGALLNQQFGVHKIIGGTIMAVISVITVFMGLNGLINSLSLIAPVLLTTAVGTSIISVYFIPPREGNIPFSQAAGAFAGNWLWSAILYVSYNVVTAIAVLGPLGHKAWDRKAIRNGAFMGGLALGLCALAIYMAVYKSIGDLGGVELPMIYIARGVSSIILLIYSIVLLASVYATAAGSLYGFTARVFDRGRVRGRLKVTAIAILAFAASQFGFSNLVKYMYPVEGFLGIILLAGLVYSKFKLMKKS